MKQNNHNRQNRRFTNNNRSSRPVQTIYRNTCLESSGPAGKLRGTPLQLNEKYTILAKDATTASDMILAEQYRQYADHYMRIQNIAIENENALRAQKEAQQATLVVSAIDKQVEEATTAAVQAIIAPETTENATNKVPEEQLNPETK